MDQHDLPKRMFRVPSTSFFIVPAPGHYGDRARVVSSHRTLAAALKAREAGECVREGTLKKGALWLRAREPFSPRVDV
jgi:hypothetical protein